VEQNGRCDREPRPQDTARTSDVRDRATSRVSRRRLQAFGKVDILVNCAGTTKRAPTLDFRSGFGICSWKPI